MNHDNDQLPYGWIQQTNEAGHVFYVSALESSTELENGILNSSAG